MPSIQRISSLAGVLLASLVLFIVVQGATQEAQTQDRITGRPSGEEPSFRASDGGGFVEGEIIVTLEEDATQSDLAALNRRNGARTEENLPLGKASVVDLPRNLPVRAAVEIYERSPDVDYAEPDFLLQPTKSPNDTYYEQYMYGKNNTGQTGGTPDADIDAPEAWENTTGDPNTVVAVIDTGVNIGHPDLSGNVWTNPGEIAGDGIDNDRNGYVDDVYGWDFFNGENTVYDSGDGDKHGTHVAGTIAAKGNNSRGVTGVNWDAQIMALKFLGPNGGRTSDAIKALDYAVKNGATISNNSWGGGGYSQALKDAIANADSRGHLFVAAAGNGGSDGVGDDNDATPHYPSNYSNPNIIAVAATNDQDNLASFSNYGAYSVDLGAPGVDILSTVPGSYAFYSGTSMAAPHVAGVAALLKSQNPLLDDGELKARILEYAEPKQSLKGRTVTGGRLNAVASLGQEAAPDDIRPSITGLKPKPGSSIRSRTPTVKAKVSDNRTELAKSDIRLYVDGKRKTRFSYDRGTDRLSHKSGRLSYGKHTVKIVAGDAAGNTAARSWSFKVRR